MDMRHISATPFGRRPVSAGLLANNALAEAPALPRIQDKWTILRDVTEGRKAFGVSDRDLAVLAALLSFHPTKELRDNDQLIVFPSNAALSGRVHGMPESTLRRHIAALTRAGLILRHDSPNGKRYATRNSAGQIDRAFGFDLRPLLVRAAEIAEAAETARKLTLQHRRLRESVVLRLRDAAKLLAWASDASASGLEALSQMLTTAQRQIRRKLPLEDLRKLELALDDLLAEIKAKLLPQAQEMSDNASQNERHHQSSESESHESDSCQREGRTRIIDGAAPKLPLELVLKAAPEISSYARQPIQSWRDLLNVSAFVHPMLGISPDAWASARRHMGDDTAAVALACILQRAAMIRCPGGYLRALTEKAARGIFSAGPMVMALLSADQMQRA